MERINVKNGMIFGDLKDARILVEVGKSLNFSQTARALKIPPATVSRRVSHMEEAAGLRLFDRSTRNVRVTEAGRIAITYAERIISDADGVTVAMESMREAPAGRIRVSSPVILGQALLGPIVANFLKAHPRCDLTLDLTNRHVDLVEENLDVAIMVGPPRDENVIAKHVGGVEAALYCSTHCSNETGLETADVERLEGARVGLLRSDDTAKPEIVLTHKEFGTRRIQIEPYVVCLDPGTLIDIAQAVDVIVVLPTLTAETPANQHLFTRLLPGWAVNRAPVNVTFMSRRLMRPVVRAFVDFVAHDLCEALSSPKE